MANDLNRCEFIGRLGKDPELNHLSSGDAVCKFSMAVGKQWKDQSGAKQESTTWINVEAWRKLADVCAQWLKKGSQIYLAGELQIRQWEDKEGQKRYSTEIVAKDIQFLGGGKGEGNGQSGAGAPPAPSGSVPEEDIPF